MSYYLERIQRATGATMLARRAGVDTAGARLTSLDPRDVLRRGYTVCLDETGRHVLRSVDDAAAAGRMRVTFHDGVVAAAVEGIEGPAAKEASS